MELWCPRCDWWAEVPDRDAAQAAWRRHREEAHDLTDNPALLERLDDSLPDAGKAAMELASSAVMFDNLIGGGS
jgi:hypothetical protein